MNLTLGLSIRRKLLIASLSLLLVPWVGYLYVQDLEYQLRTEQEKQLLSRAALVALIMEEHPDRFQARSHAEQNNANHLYVRPLQYPVTVDGYAIDWQHYPARLHTLTAENAIAGDQQASPQDIEIQYQIGSTEQSLYLLLRVKDEQLIYRSPNATRLDQSDHLRIGLTDQQGHFSRYWLSTISPGWVDVHAIGQHAGQIAYASTETRIKSEWQEVPGGYTIEIEIPLEMIGGHFSFAFVDVDNPTTRAFETAIGTGSTHRKQSLGTIIIATPTLEKLLRRIQKPSERIWVVNPEYQVVSLAGGGFKQSTEQTQATEESVLSQIMRIIFRTVLPQPPRYFEDSLMGASRIDNPAITEALDGKAAVRWRHSSNENLSILIAAQPVYRNDKLLGVVAIEETNGSILIMQNRALEVLISLSLLSFLVTTIILLGFATRLSYRIRKLRNEAEQSIGNDGRVLAEITTTRIHDEIGDLNHSFSTMLNRLSQYNLYLETMASKLAHELRTPISVVRSSLDNLENTQTAEEAAVYRQRAKEGINRLSGILTRMSEATRLEQTLQHEDVEVFNLTKLVQACSHAYAQTHTLHHFPLTLKTDHDVWLKGSPELIAQLLDKLTDNARDFAPKHSDISIVLDQTNEYTILSVLNQGPALPATMQGNLFDSMVSLRSEKTEQPHLGLGLYIVRLIADFHHGKASVHNLHDDAGVRFDIHFPMCLPPS